MSSSNTSIMTIGEMIDTAFGDTNTNVVNHKLLQTILFLLARQLRILERKVKLEMGVGLPLSSSSSLSVTEIKVHAMQKKKTKASKGERHTKGSHEHPSSSDKTSSERSKDKSSSKSTTDKTVTETTTDKSSSTKSTDKSTTEKSTTLTSTDKSSSEKDAKSAKKSSKDYRHLLEMIEEQRERELRVIHQRATSREERDKTPTPMASLDSVEAQYEKLLVVERVPTEGGKAKSARTTPRLSVVTQEQFAELSAAVQELMAKFAPIGLPSFPENIELMQELRKNASLADAMAALQLAARLEAAEKTLRQMLSLVTELATKTGIDLTESLAGKLSAASRKSKKDEPSRPLSQESIEIPILSPSPPHAAEPQREIFPTDKPSKLMDFVTYEELDSAMQELYDDIKKTVTGITTRSKTNAENAFKIATKMEQKLEASLNLGTRMDDLEVLVSEYAEQINVLDTGLSSQMTNYQEQLTQMQHDLETGLENMAEQLANTGTDTTAVAELNSHFTSLQQDLDNSAINQKELKDSQRALYHDLEGLWKQIEILRETKSDREEVADALRDKAGIGALNGLVSLQQFDAVRGDFEKRIGAAYDKFNNQEIIWQKAIEDLLRVLNDKADWIQLVSLRDEITKYLDMLKSRIQAMFEIVGEPRAAAITRRLHREAACLSCSTPAWMDVEEPGIVPALPALQAARPPTIGAEASKPREDGDHGLCYPGHPISHPRDIRSHVCQRFCGGSHTVINKTISRSPPGMIISPLRQPSTALGTDGKVYKTDESVHKVPCAQCNVPSPTAPEPNEAAQVPEQASSSNMTPSDFRRMTDLIVPSMEQVSVTPPPPLDEDF